ncbi:glycine-rich cell wall structural protein 1-like [Solanum verrucosum]|uniref:glycine-rich cell wall structural protein 1-like n=1 Tax=Solanum verrucosum TaxID=315347 RepID=UPI0020D07CD5|nr:glycine-rich cell wall structural protein 1-like [Solanum verrucosum]
MMFNWPLFITCSYAPDGAHKPLINSLPRSKLGTRATTIKRDLSVVGTGVGGVGGDIDSTGGGAGNVGDTGVGGGGNAGGINGGAGGGVGGRDIKTSHTLEKYSTDGGGGNGVVGGIGVGHDIRTPYTLEKYSIVGVGTSKVNS